VVSKVVSNGISYSLYLDGSYRTGDLVRATYSPLRFKPILVTPRSSVAGANGHSSSLWEVL